MKLGIIDYGAGNLRSVANAVKALGLEPTIIPNGESLNGITHLILPGVGSFGDCMGELTKRGLVEPLRQWIAAGKPYLGICLGYHALFESSEETPGIAGLGVLKGHVKRFDERGLKIPHMGWNSANPVDASSPLWKGLGSEPYFYFVHSYFPVPADRSIIAATTEYGEEFASGVATGALAAFQFHPEKSQDAGLGLLRNFLGLA